ncbi:hypothetical protein AB0N38_31330 [Micromonospora aurantiaca]|uniref:phasin family protein n=1 Tax=Micromonospora aurantiaca (nom. illeg.) TaxID=47850 RepID=UPI000828035D|nr:hypothetical protein [Micromonospora aurantiaca]SCL30127.1 Polyhydroxyalkanoate synthesis regulator phasin [Micromonospora aurantiaca]
MQDAWRAYLELAMGLTEAPRKKAQDAVMRVVGQGGATAAQLQTLAEELVATGLANRESLTKLVRFEVDRALGAVGLATADEVAELTRRVHDLERQLREARGHLGPGDTPSGAAEPPKTGSPAAESSPATTPAKAPATTPTKAVAKKAVAKKAIAKKPPATVARTPADGSPAAPARPAKKATGRRAAGS